VVRASQVRPLKPPGKPVLLGLSYLTPFLPNGFVETFLTTWFLNPTPSLVGDLYGQEVLFKLPVLAKEALIQPWYSFRII